MRESLYEILEINSIWLTEEQKEELREDLKNGKSLDGEIFEKLFLWFSRLKLTLTEWSEAKNSVSFRCYLFRLKDARDLLQSVIILQMRAELLYIAECNNFESDLHILTGIVDEKMKRNDIVKKYCDLTKNYTKIRDKRESKGLTRSENKLEHYFKILNLDWLNDQQREYLKNMPSKGIREALRDAVVNWFNHLHPAAKELATDLFKGGCNKLLRIRQEGCGYFGLLDTQKINELKNYDDLTTYNEINELINPLREKLELRKIANDYNQTCRELFGIGEEVETEEKRGVGLRGTRTSGRKRRYLNNNDDEYKKRKIGESLEAIFKIHSSWLTKEQKEELREDLKNGKSLDGEIYEKVFMWYRRLGLSDWSYEMLDFSSGCVALSSESLRNTKQAAEITMIEISLSLIECNNLSGDIKKLEAIVDEKSKRFDIVTKYCDFRKNNTKIRAKRESRGHKSSENKLSKYFKILNLDWLDDKQREHLKDIKGVRTSEERRDTNGRSTKLNSTG
ncbi:unnamed protein product [Meloidogyne enterolobii]|uniref:Uncharacterized protein n=1 Tax=Meloidogyne enterolobii TaxID=390850 RepID=A0ACB0XV06_MELEN